MEKLFIAILNRSLLSGCLLLLGVTVIVALLAIVNFVGAKNPGIDHGYVNVAYVPLTPLSATEAAPGTGEDLSNRPSPDDIRLREQATPGCQALGRVAAAISNKRLDMRGEGLIACEKSQATTAKEFGDKAGNYLSELAGYFGQLTNDPHLAARYPDTGGDDQTRLTLDELARDFESKFQAQVSAQDSKNEAALADAAAQRLAATTYLIAAAAAFLGFLYLAFLIVFLRIEKHIDKMSA